MERPVSVEPAEVRSLADPIKRSANFSRKLVEGDAVLVPDKLGWWARIVRINYSGSMAHLFGREGWYPLESLEFYTGPRTTGTHHGPVVNQQQPSKDWSKTAYPEANAYIESLGIDPNTVYIVDMTVEGYWELQLDESGRRIRGDSKLREWRKWPTLADGIRIIDMVKPWEDQRK